MKDTTKQREKLTDTTAQTDKQTDDITPNQATEQYKQTNKLTDSRQDRMICLTGARFVTGAEHKRLKLCGGAPTCSGNLRLMSSR